MYLAETLKSSIFYPSFYDTVKEIATAAKPQTPNDAVQVVKSDDPKFVIIMQSMLGGGLKAAKKQFCPETEAKDHGAVKGPPMSAIANLFEHLIYRHDAAKAVSQEYQQYYPEEFGHRNTGGLHLISLKFMPWAIKLMSFIINSYTDDHINTNRKEYIAVVLTKLKKDDTFLRHFKSIALTLEGVVQIEDKQMSAIHLRIALYSCRAYSKQRHNARFNSCKTKASDYTNLAFRTQIQAAVGSKAKEGGGKNQPASTTITTSTSSNNNPTTTNSTLNALLPGLKPTRTKRTKQQIIEDMNDPYDKAVGKLVGTMKGEDAMDANTAKLSMKECGAILTLGFDDYTNGGKVGDLRVSVNRELIKGKSQHKFWTAVDALASTKRKHDDVRKTPPKRKDVRKTPPKGHK